LLAPPARNQMVFEYVAGRFRQSRRLEEGAQVSRVVHRQGADASRCRSRKQCQL